MGRITVTVPDDVEEWLEAESDRLGWSKSKTGGECIKMIHSESEHITSHHTDAQQSDVLEQLEQLEQRVAALESPSHPSEPLLSESDETPTEPQRADETPTLADVDFPATRDHTECVETVEAVRDYLQREERATMREIVRNVMPDHSLGYDVPELAEGERYRGGWWRSVVKPGLQALPPVESPPTGGSEWRWVG